MVSEASTVFFSIYGKGNWGSRRDMRKAAVKRNREVIFQTHLWMEQNVIGLFNKKGEAGWLLGLGALLEGSRALGQSLLGSHGDFITGGF